MPLDSLLIEILACPVDKGPLLWFDEDDTLYNPRLKVAYRVTDGIPVLLPEEGRSVDEAEDARLMAAADGAIETGHGPDASYEGDRAADT